MAGDTDLHLLSRAMDVLQLNQGEVADKLGCSRRTVQRWFGGDSVPYGQDLVKLAPLVLPHDPALAEDLARCGGTTLEALGLVQPKAPPVPPPHLTEAVVCAAAEALNVPPPVVRPVLLAAFRAARELGLGVGDVEAALARKLGV